MLQVHFDFFLCLAIVDSIIISEELCGAMFVTCFSTTADVGLGAEAGSHDLAGAFLGDRLQSDRSKSRYV